MSVAEYLLGIVVLGAVVGALGFGATRARARWLPTWHGAPARLVEIAGALAVLITAPQLLGAVGLFRRGALTATLVVIGVVTGVVASHGAPRSTSDTPEMTEDLASDDPREPAPASLIRTARWRRVATIAAGVLVLVTFAQWGAHVGASYAHGIRDGDSLWYHLPFAVHFVQTGYTTRPLFTNADALVTYFPGNTETLNGLTMALTGRDVLVPLVNVGWLALATLAAWCIGSRYRAPAVGMGALAMVMGIPLMAATQGGTTRNDIASVALILTAVALVLHARWDAVALAFAGAANGLAFGVKLSSVPVAAFLAIGVIVVAPRARRRAILLPWLGTFVVFGAFWYVRNLVRVGNPLPWVALKVGPISLPEVYARATSNTAVLDRLREHGAYSRVLKPGLDYALGPQWWLLLLILAGVVVGLVAAGRGRTARMLGVVALLGILAYIAMPNGSPDANSAFGSLIFGLNVRYAFAAVTLAFVCVAALPRVYDGRVETAVVAVLGGLEVTHWASRHNFETHFEWLVTGRERATAVAVILGLLGVALVVVALLRRGGTGTATRANLRARRGGVALAGAGVLVIVIGAYFVADIHLDDRYQVPIKDAQSAQAWKWAQSIPASRVAIFGDLIQYPYVGPALANRVRYVGVETSHSGFREPRSCREWRTALAAGRYDYLVTSVNFVGTNLDQVNRVRGWTETVPGTRVVLDAAPVKVYRLTQSPDPDACP